MAKKPQLLKSKSDIFIYLLYVATTVFFLFPILCIISISLKTPAEIFGNPSLIPHNPTLENYAYVWNRTKMPLYIKNSLILVLYTVIGTLLVASLSAYGLSRFTFKRKNLVVIAILMFQMISDVVICIPLFRLFSKAGLLNQYWALGLAYVATQTPFATYLLKGVFDGIPKAMDDSASIDGANRLTILTRIILPCSKSGISSTIIFLSINAWSSFLLPFILLSQDKMRPVSVGILTVQGLFMDITIQYLAAAAVLGLLPAILIVIFLQKFIISAMMSGAVKG